MSEMPIKLCFAARKGGEGKTFGAVNISAQLLALGYRVLIVGCDPQEDLAVLYLSSQDPDDRPFNEYGHVSLCDVIGEGRPIQDAIYRTRSFEAYKWSKGASGPERKPCGTYKLDIVTSGIDIMETDGFYEESPDGPVPKYHLFDEILSPVYGDYDFIVFDCPPSVSDISMCAYAASDIILVPCQSIDSIRSIIMMDNTVAMLNSLPETGHRIQVLIYLNRYSARQIQPRQLRQMSEELFGGRVLRQPLRQAADAGLAKGDGEPVVSYFKSELGYDFVLLTDEILGRIRSMPGLAGRLK